MVTGEKRRGQKQNNSLFNLLGVIMLVVGSVFLLRSCMYSTIESPAGVISWNNTLIGVVTNKVTAVNIVGKDITYFILTVN